MIGPKKSTNRKRSSWMPMMQAGYDPKMMNQCIDVMPTITFLSKVCSMKVHKVVTEICFWCTKISAFTVGFPL